MKIKELFDNAATVAVLTTYALAGLAADEIQGVRDRWSGAGNGVDAKVESTDRIKIDGLENEIAVPVPSREDLKWARGFYNTASLHVADAIGESIRKEQHWRTWFLINRPSRHSHVPLSHGGYGFRGNLDLTHCFARACANDNVTAAYYFLKFAEQKPTFHRSTDGAVTGEMRDREVRYLALDALPRAAKSGAGRVVALLVNTLCAVPDAGGRNTDYHSRQHREDAVMGAAEAGRTDYLDLFLSKGLIEAQLFLTAYEKAFTDPTDGRGMTGRNEYLGSERRKVLADWIAAKNLADASFPAKAAALEARAAALKANPLPPRRRAIVLE